MYKKGINHSVSATDIFLATEISDRINVMTFPAIVEWFHDSHTLNGRLDYE
jgi:hypothetical protein